MSAVLNVGVLDSGHVAIITPSGTSICTPQVAIEISQSLINAAKEADPLINAEHIIREYNDRNYSYKPN
jgi:hypothetical protein